MVELFGKKPEGAEKKRVTLGREGRTAKPSHSVGSYLKCVYSRSLVRQI